MRKDVSHGVVRNACQQSFHLLDVLEFACWEKRAEVLTLTTEFHGCDTRVNFFWCRRSQGFPDRAIDGEVRSAPRCIEISKRGIKRSRISVWRGSLRHRRKSQFFDRSRSFLNSVTSRGVGRVEYNSQPYRRAGSPAKIVCRPSKLPRAPPAHLPMLFPAAKPGKIGHLDRL